MQKRIGFLGAGQMARALAGGFLRAGLVEAKNIVASDLLPDAGVPWRDATGSRFVESNAETIAGCEIAFIAVKPQAMPALLKEIRPLLKPHHLIVSIAAGVTLARLAEGLGEAVRIVRVMPNTPCLVNAAASGVSLGGAATKADGETVLALFGAVGVAVLVPESQLDAVTGLSGSGPAYIFQVIEALSDGGVRAGLPRNAAATLAAQTVLGAARMVLETGKHPGELKDQVASPGGTTIAGLAVLERAAVRGAFIDAVAAAAERSRELGGG